MPDLSESVRRPAVERDSACAPEGLHPPPAALLRRRAHRHRAVGDAGGHGHPLAAKRRAARLFHPFRPAQLPAVRVLALLAELAVDIPKYRVSDALLFGLINVAEVTSPRSCSAARSSTRASRSISDFAKFVVAGPVDSGVHRRGVRRARLQPDAGHRHRCTSSSSGSGGSATRSG